MNILGSSIKEVRKSKKLTQKKLAELTGFKQNTISNHENGNRQLDEKDIRIYAQALEVSPQYLFDLAKPSSIEIIPTTSPIQTIYDELEPPRQGKVLNYAKRQLDEQENEEETKINEVSEVISLYQVEVVSETAAASGFNYGFGYDDTDREIIEVDEQPPHHDIATKVSGDSMQPDYQDGDILYLVDKGLTTYNGDLAVIAYGDRSYFKKIYTENGRLRLVSLNDKYEDIILDFPPAEDTHIKIYAVVSVYRGE
ncbi:helix-turn-helix transcriptional regulator [Streptococcus pneumoniae]|uniref:LexA family transcriptional regulator n=5 Tax=Streptococcus pneumoniae TaxID=1313 RepID=UPI0005DDE092|nr:S24 family peptidase [Streptococcus pneumoniae]MBW5231133.1 helix-turn-helix domain-containing protein [Streptococcus pneumoniae]MDG7058873.1 helix-turn-helix domain-containing protein [Streptococcus pneumoniae]MDG7143257.1 helix-turn-helix domain-containing protein [Streptococcus pneumoniae]MDG7563809.1 helix-turn-helix domain-containing protein [Streptococcus pneumoniae]MDG7867976.1 helix-turn-helix domain-containing protein [Streptococcus pneumoniae]